MSNTGKTLREKIAAFPDVKEKIITVKEWGNEKILIRGITAGARYNIFLDQEGKPRKDIARSTVQSVIECSFDPKSREKLFTTEDVEMLLDKNSDAIEFIASEIQEISSMTVKAQEQIEKNSGSGTPQE